LTKPLRYISRFFIGLLILFVVAWLLLWAYVHFNKAGIISKVKTQISQQVDGRVDIKDITVDLFSTFPNISVRLADITVRDSLWERHHHDFFKAEKVFTRLEFFSLFTGKPSIGKIIVDNASVYLFTDSTGYTNLVRAKKKEGDGKKRAGGIPDFLFRHTRFVMENVSRHKLHDIEAIKLECKPVQTDSLLKLNIDIDAIVHSLAFNTEKGSYLKEKPLSGDFTLRLDAQKNLLLKDVELEIDKHPFVFNGTFYTAAAQPHFHLAIETKKVKYAGAVSLLNPVIQAKLNLVGIDEPVNMKADLNGLLAYRSIPLVKIDMEVKDAKLVTPVGSFNECTFNGSFNNQEDPAQLRTDENSAIRLSNFKAKWSEIPITAKSIKVVNLKQPFIDCDLQSTFQLTNFNELAGSNSLQFSKGSGEMNIQYKGTIAKSDSAYPFLNGTIQFREAELAYLPRNLLLKNCSGTVRFKDQDVFIEKLKAQGGGTSLVMDGSIKNLLTLINNNPEKLEINWNISTPSLNVVDFMNYLGNRSATVAKKGSAAGKIKSASGKIDRMLEYGTAQLTINAGKVLYKKFQATNVGANISLLQGRIVLNSARLNHAGGVLAVSGSLTDGAGSNPLQLKANLTNVDIPGIFYGFNNFGQDAITDKNMKGRISAAVLITGALNNKAAQMISNLDGTVNFSISNAELNNFEPLQKVSEVIFKKRDFSNVRFAELKNTLTIHGSAININRMEINSSVFTMFVEGVYDTKKGTDLDLRVPLRNLKKMDGDAPVRNTGKIGSNVRLRAKTGDDGKLKVKLVLFGKKEE